MANPITDIKITVPFGMLTDAAEAGKIKLPLCTVGSDAYGNRYIYGHCAAALANNATAKISIAGEITAEPAATAMGTVLENVPADAGTWLKLKFLA